jgi:hypothetical protein
MQTKFEVVLLAALLTFAPLAAAEEPAAEPEPAADELLLERTEITGNRELPKVLYIVPWRKPDPGALLGKPVNTLLDDVLAPLDREEFIRQVDYYSDLYDEPSTTQPPLDGPVGARPAGQPEQGTEE